MENYFIYAVLYAWWLTGLVAVMLIGLWAMIAPTHFLTFNKKTSRWIGFWSNEQVKNLADKSFASEKFIYRHHIISGSVLFAMSGFIVWLIRGITIQRFSKSSWEPALSMSLDDFRIAMLLDVLIGYGLIIAVFGMVFSLVVMVRPSVLKRLEVLGNYWIDTVTFESKLNKVYDAPDRWVEKHPVVFGGAVYSIALAILIFIEKM
ncbi:MAG: hypothetical protein H0W44_01430 [Gammaproteobacteria bacterium]|nr:hypothetical protein [Gammaproteobacteria bacterium]